MTTELFKLVLQCHSIWGQGPSPACWGSLWGALVCAVGPQIATGDHQDARGSNGVPWVAGEPPCGPIGVCVCVCISEFLRGGARVREIVVGAAAVRSRGHD